MSGRQLFETAEQAYVAGNNAKTFEYYQKAIKKIIKNENILAAPYNYNRRNPGSNTYAPDSVPDELLAYAFKNFTAFFKDPELGFTEATEPEAFRFLSSFRVSAKKKKEHARFVGPRALFLLKCLQISASYTLGLLAWDKQDRATAAKRYQEAIDLADTDPVFSSPSPAVGLETWIAEELKDTRVNLERLMLHDEYGAEFLRSTGREGGDLRGETSYLPYIREDARNGNAETVIHDLMFATDACATCGGRGVKFKRCGKCKKVAYCGVDCQRAHWADHKGNCTASSF